MGAWHGLRWTGLICILTAAAASQAQELGDPPLLRAPDHVLVWSERPGAAERVFAGLGFTLRPGQTYPEGITASTVVFGDWSYLELLHFSDPGRAAGSVQARSELAFVADGPGANSFAVEVRDVAAAQAYLRRQGFAVAEVVPDMVDPDGPTGQRPPRVASWRDFHFATSPVAGADIFFIQYPPEPPASSAEPQDDAPFTRRTTHANTARRLSAIWMLVPDLAAEADVYRHMGFALSPITTVPHLYGEARVATLGSGAVILVQSPRLPDDFRTPRRAGPRVIGLSFEVGDLAAARTAVLRPGAQIPLEVRSPLGPALLVQSTAALGMFVEFHEGHNATVE